MGINHDTLLDALKDEWWEPQLQAQGVFGLTAHIKNINNGDGDNRFRLYPDDGPGRRTIIFIPNATDFEQPVELCYYLHGQEGFNEGEMKDRIIPQLKKMITTGRNIIFVYPELSFSFSDPETKKSSRKKWGSSIAWNGANTGGNFYLFHWQVAQHLVIFSLFFHVLF